MTDTPPGLAVAPAPPDFAEWETLLALLRRAFAYMEGRVDPPSSLTRMDAAALRDKAGAEALLLAHDAAGGLIGCLSGMAITREEYTVQAVRTALFFAADANKAFY